MYGNDILIAGFREEIHELRLMVKELKLERDMLIDELADAQREAAGEWVDDE